MKKHLIYLALTAFSVTGVYAQKPEEPYKFSKAIEAAIANDTVSWKYQTGAVNFTFTGEYKRTLLTWDKAVPPRVYTPTRTDSTILATFRIKNAKEYILDRSREEQLILINEAHHDPKHRTFTRSLLEGLYKNGYRYLGLEALFDTTINQRKYATLESGYYTAEPEFGNLIHEALRIGFVLFGYEATGGKNGKEREIEQAKNIQAFMSQNTAGKYLIHCGFDHVFEKEVRNWEKAMAGRLKEYTKIDPFTIDQVKFSEKSQPAFGHYFLYATTEKQPFVLISPQGEAFNGLSEPKQTDLAIIHPISDYLHDRPHWTSFDKTPFVLPPTQLRNFPYPLQALAYRTGEYENNGIPADVIELANPSVNKFLYLKKGKYTIVIRNQEYVVQTTLDVEITR